MSAPYGYPPQQAPQYPAQPMQQPYPQQFPQPYPQQGFGQPFAPPAQPMGQPQQPLAQGSLDDFYSQPSAGGGKSLAFATVGTRFVGIVTRAVTSGDIQQQTNTQGVPQTFRDGRPKFVMKVPLQMQPSPEFPDGLATWYVKGQARDELVRAMSEAGASGAPEANAIIDVTYVGDRSSGPGMNPAKQFAVTYQRPNGGVSQPLTPAQPAQQAFSPAQQAPAQPAPAQQAQPAQQPMQMPPDMTADQQSLLARLTGRQQGAPTG